MMSRRMRFSWGRSWWCASRTSELGGAGLLSPGAQGSEGRGLVRVAAAELEGEIAQDDELAAHRLEGGEVRGEDEVAAHARRGPGVVRAVGVEEEGQLGPRGTGRLGADGPEHGG